MLFDLCKLYFSSQCLPLRPQMSVPLYQALTALNDHDDVEDVVNDDVDTNFEHKNQISIKYVMLVWVQKKNNPLYWLT